MKTKEKLAEKYRTWVELDTKAISQNYRTFRKLIPKKTALMAVVKSNAYGHGLMEFSLEVEKLGVDWLGVDSVVEATALRREGIKKPILVLGYTLPNMFVQIVDHNIQMSVATFEQLDALRRVRQAHRKQAQGKRFLGVMSIHIKVDTGMHRQGFLMEDSERLFKVLAKMRGQINVAGLFTHFAAAKNPNGPDATKKQIAEFNEWRKLFKENGYDPITHASATAGALLYPEAHYDLVRIGIGMFGMWPSAEVRKYAEGKIKLVPVLSWKTIISEIKELPKGTSIGYDFTEKVSRDSKVAVCPVGYWHGYLRAFSGKAETLVHGKRAKIIGRVSMGMIVIDVTNIKGVKVGDMVTLLGKDKKETVAADELAKIAGTVHYEIVTGINPRIKRVVK
jgi:alanine racemase